jgi:histidine triad (HIT) family protein
MFEKNQIENMKQQVIEHIQKNFPEDKKQSAIEQILSMNDEEFIETLKENNIIQDENGNLNENQREGKCIFCSIVFGDSPSIKIGENEKAIAILEINPISEGHTLIIPKNHISSKEKIDSKTESLTVVTKEKIENSLKPKEIKVFASEVSGHAVINIVPIYNDETVNSQRKHATNDELLKIKEKIEKTNKEIANQLNDVKEDYQDEMPPKEEKPEMYVGIIPRRIP